MFFSLSLLLPWQLIRSMMIPHRNFFSELLTIPFALPITTRFLSLQVLFAMTHGGHTSCSMQSAVNLLTMLFLTLKFRFPQSTFSYTRKVQFWMRNASVWTVIFAAWIRTSLNLSSHLCRPLHSPHYLLGLPRNHQTPCWRHLPLLPMLDITPSCQRPQVRRKRRVIYFITTL